MTTSPWQTLFQLARDQRADHRVHMIGIGGTGLAPIAHILLELGFQVSGSDQAASERTGALRRAGADVFIGHDAAHLSNAERAPLLPDCILISSAVPTHNPEIQAAQAANIPIIKRADFLGPLTADREVIAVAGTHGKTTTTAMITQLLVNLGYAPGYIIGSEVAGLGASAAGQGSLFVIEADEYDYAFLGLDPTLIVLPSLEWDHPDCFPTPESYLDAFRQFLDRLRPGGHVIYCNDDENLRRLASEREHPTNWHGYGLRPGATWRSNSIDVRASGVGFTIHAPSGALIPAETSVPGLHNVLNATAAILAVTLAGASIAQAAAQIGSYKGAGRRFERKGEVNDILIIDDYAHHPTEIRATLAAARAIYPDRTIWAVYQPHTYSRTRALLDLFEGAFAAADHLIVTDIYAAREEHDPNVTPAQVIAYSRHPDAHYIASLDDVLSYLAEHVRPNSAVIILSAGTATQLGPALPAALSQTMA